MKRFLLPALIVIAGVVLIVEPMAARGACDNPVINVPSKCEPAHVTDPVVTGGGYCYRQSDGTCLSLGCSATITETAVRGRCGTGVITENNVPRCESNYVATTLTVHQYVMSCGSTTGSCGCVSMATGQTTTVTVCNCRDIAPLH